MGCPDRSCNDRKAIALTTLFKDETRQKTAGDHRAEYDILTALRCKEMATAVRDVCFRFCFLFRPDGALKMSVL